MEIKTLHITSLEIPVSVSSGRIPFMNLEKSVINNIGVNKLGNTQCGQPLKYVHKNSGNSETINIIRKFSSIII